MRLLPVGGRLWLGGIASLLELLEVAWPSQFSYMNVRRDSLPRESNVDPQRLSPQHSTLQPSNVPGGTGAFVSV